MKYTKELLQEAADASMSIAGVLRFLGLKQAGGTQSHIARRMTELEVDTEHFTGQGHSAGTVSKARRPADDILVLNDPLAPRVKSKLLNRALIEIGRPYECTACGLTGEWNGGRLVLEVDHIDGRFWNNVEDNLRFLCPNCHSQQETNRPHKNS